MTDQNGLLTPDEFNHVVRYLDHLFPNNTLKCPLCHHPDFNIEQIFVTPIQMTTRGVGLHHGAPTLPLVALRCTHCSNTLFFNAVEMGMPGFSAENGKLGADRPIREGTKDGR